ncbi:Vesicle transport V-snare protein [Coemansia sp. RSA 1813]|nr:t-SNARE VTI1 [Coemansia sp. RSA 1646]KAJ1767092.1 Vesicle transport V-snare protein [Coemansia sp. RSA 1843]KAJ2086531.1 Vesicle transport V-snare protein [Coemansia sp. RSA 986]KAJ2211874.1 Vesicle transport V-snare protein [Coemansia sp. RSA 487]KAJ2564887.1 Vesicle transport V-snare protein [Coemansia sp. RSA 1813]
MSSELFDNYEAEYGQLVESIRQRLATANDVDNSDDNNRRTGLRAAEREIDEANELAGQMEMELLSLQGPTRSRAAPRVRQYKADVERLRRDVRKAVSESALGNYDANRKALLGAADIGLEEAAMDTDQRSRLLSGNERLTQGSRRLQQSHRLAMETEAVGAGILTDLRSQREQIVNTRDTLMQADGHLDRSNRTLRTMTRRLMTNKMITTGLIVVGVALVILVLYVKLTR